MFPEGQGKPNAKAKLAAVVPMINELFVNAKSAVSAFFKARGYEPTRPAYTKEKLGYALDQYEAIAFVTLRVTGHPLLAPEGEEARIIAKRCNNLLTPIEKKLKGMRKLGARAAEDRAKLLGAKAALSLEMPARKAPAAAPAPAPAPPPAPAPAPAPLPAAPASIPWGARPLSHAGKLRKRRILDAWSNDACTCEHWEVGAAQVEARLSAAAARCVGCLRVG